MNRVAQEAVKRQLTVVGHHAGLTQLFSTFVFWFQRTVDTYSEKSFASWNVSSPEASIKKWTYILGFQSHSWQYLWGIDA